MRLATDRTLLCFYVCVVLPRLLPNFRGGAGQQQCPSPVRPPAGVAPSDPPTGSDIKWRRDGRTVRRGPTSGRSPPVRRCREHPLLRLAALGVHITIVPSVVTVFTKYIKAGERPSPPSPILPASRRIRQASGRSPRGWDGRRRSGSRGPRSGGRGSGGRGSPTATSQRETARP